MRFYVKVNGSSVSNFKNITNAIREFLSVGELCTVTSKPTSVTLECDLFTFEYLDFDFIMINLFKRTMSFTNETALYSLKKLNEINNK